MSPLITWKYISFKNATHKGNWVSGQRLLKLGWCLTANLPINKRILNIFLEAATLESLLRWLPNLAGLCLTTYRAFLSHEKCKIISESFLHLDESGQELKKTKNVAFGSFFDSCEPQPTPITTKIHKEEVLLFSGSPICKNWTKLASSFLL